MTSAPGGDVGSLRALEPDVDARTVRALCGDPGIVAWVEVGRSGFGVRPRVRTLSHWSDALRFAALFREAAKKEDKTLPWQNRSAAWLRRMAERFEAAAREASRLEAEAKRKAEVEQARAQGW